LSVLEVVRERENVREDGGGGGIEHGHTHKQTGCRPTETPGGAERVRTRPLNSLEHTATCCNALQHTATRCNTLQHAVTCGNILQHTNGAERV